MRLPHSGAQARHNFHCAQDLRDGGRHLEWACTALFYECLHLMDVCFTQRGINPPENHYDRGVLFADFASIDADVAYQQLKDASRRARYQLSHPDEGELDRLFTYYRQCVWDFMIADGVAILYD